CLQGYSPPFNF
nr:immunoglobulin light chain junction region [Macaca mulatta]MOV35080.1 immunoglobulin light chain junction region [Macaca mulatta]MOV35218.1 immunoglobulin light chain junction region [Macaca mulatta]MOV35515.1 immunoglobulin light chain junction region [Macaca mulatta]